MDTGMLWFDDSDQPLSSKIKRAVTYYQEKYEKQPNLCVVHPTMIPEGETKVEEVEVRQATAVMPHHYWIGIHQAEKAARSRKAA
jgi:hypothetical protein